MASRLVMLAQVTGAQWMSHGGHVLRTAISLGVIDSSVIHYYSVKRPMVVVGNLDRYLVCLSMGGNRTP